jgi:hypothetical protein
MSTFSETIIKSFFKGIGQASGIAITIMVGLQLKNTFYHFYQFYPLVFSSRKQIGLDMLELDHEEINDEDVKSVKDEVQRDAKKSKIIRKLFDKL